MTKLVPILGVIAMLASPLAASAQNVGHIASAKRGRKLHRMQSVSG